MRGVRASALATMVTASVLMVCLQLNVTAMPFYESGAFFLLAGASLYLALSCPGWRGSALSLSLTGTLFGLRLAAMWRMDKVNPHLIGGLLPYSDASSYYTEALRLLEFGQFSWATVNAGRPMWPGTIATLLSVTGGDLQIALALLTAIVACACYCFVRETQLSFGTGTATMVFLALYLFYAQFIGVTSSEALGLALGALGAGLLLRAVRDSSRVVFWSGLFLLGLGLQARPGAFFILPALVLWGTWSFGDGRRFRTEFMAGCGAAVALGFVIQSLFMTFLVDPTAPPAFTKIGLMAWSLAVGRSPDDIYLVHPEGRGLSPQQLNPLILDWAWAAFWAHPLSVIRDAGRATMAYFYLGGGLVDYLDAPLRVIWAIVVLNLLGWVRLAVRFRDSRYGMVAAAIVGIVVSVPMIAYVGSRANAAAMPLMVIPMALAVSWIIAGLRSVFSSTKWRFPIPAEARWRQWVHPPTEIHKPQSALIFGLAMAAMVIIGPFGIKSFHQPLSLPDYRCPNDEVSAYLRLNSGSVVNVVEDARLSQTLAPNVRNRDYGKPWGGTADNLPPSFERELVSIEAEHTLIQGVDLRTAGATGILWLKIPTTLVPKDPGIVRFCLPPSRNGMFTPSSAEVMSGS